MSEYDKAIEVLDRALSLLKVASSRPKPDRATLTIEAYLELHDDRGHDVIDRLFPDVQAWSVGTIEDRQFKPWPQLAFRHETLALEWADFMDDFNHHPNWKDRIWKVSYGYVPIRFAAFPKGNVIGEGYSPDSYHRGVGCHMKRWKYLGHFDRTDDQWYERIG